MTLCRERLGLWAPEGLNRGVARACCSAHILSGINGVAMVQSHVGGHNTAVRLCRCECSILETQPTSVHINTHCFDHNTKMVVCTLCKVPMEL